MSDHDLTTALDSLYSERMAAPAPPELHRRAFAVPAAVPPARRARISRFGVGGFGAMFGALKGVAAGLVIAVFGGFLLFALILGGPSEDAPPAASPSPTASASPQRTQADLLPGVELETEVLDPGVYRVLADGTRDLTRNVRDVAVSTEGDVFVTKFSVVRLPEDGDPGGYSPFFKDNRVLRLGDGSASRHSEGTRPDGLDPVPWGFRDGADVGVILESERPLRFEGEAWHRFAAAPASCGLEAWGVRPMPAADDECWGLWGHEPRLSRLGEDGQWRGSGLEGADFGLHPETRIGEQFVITGDGIVVATAREIESGFIGLLSGLGDSWSLIPYPGDGLASLGRQETLDIAPDGTIWVTNLGNGELTAASWDGDAWRSFGPVQVESRLYADDTRVVPKVEPHFLDDGTVWFAPLAVFDGSQLQAVNVLDGIAIDAPVLEELVVAPDGSAWAVIADHGQEQAEGRVDSGLYVIRPDELTYADQP